MTLRIIFLLLLSVPVALAQQATVTMNEFVAAWKVSRDYTIAVADAMPPDSYSFKPVPEEFSFAEQMLHLAHVNYSWFLRLTGDAKAIADPKTEDKQAVLAYLGATFDYCIGALGRLTPEQLSQTLDGIADRSSGSGRDALLNLYMHTAHHRGQAVVYLRLKGIKPPEYRY